MAQRSVYFPSRKTKYRGNSAFELSVEMVLSQRVIPRSVSCISNSKMWNEKPACMIVNGNAVTAPLSKSRIVKGAFPDCVHHICQKLQQGGKILEIEELGKKNAQLALAREECVETSCEAHRHDTVGDISELKAKLNSKTWHPDWSIVQKEKVFFFL